MVVIFYNLSNFYHHHQPCPGPLVEYPTSRACRVVALSTGEVVQQVVAIMMMVMMTMITTADSEWTLKVSENLRQKTLLSYLVKRLQKIIEILVWTWTRPKITIFNLYLPKIFLLILTIKTYFQTVTPTELCSPKDVFRLRLNIAKQYRDGAGQYQSLLELENIYLKPNSSFFRPL